MKQVILVAIMWLAVSAGALRAQEIPPAAAEVLIAEGKITGLVVSATTGEILRSAQVTLRGRIRGARGGRQRGNAFTKQASTGINGHFYFSELPPGEYRLTARKAGHRVMVSPVGRTLGERQSVEGVVLRLYPSPAIMGRVLDDHGEPVAEARVQALARRPDPSGGVWVPAATAETDDQGEYRLHGLTVGRFFVYAEGPREPSPRGVTFAAFTPAFYPNALSTEQAIPVRLGWAAELTGIDFRLDPSADTTVEGLVLDTVSGEPCGECQIMVLRDGEDRMPDRIRPTPEGAFAIRGLEPGPYRLAARFRESRRWRTGAVEIQVPSSGNLAVQIEVGPGQTVSGELVLEDPPDEEQSDDPAAVGESARRRARTQVFLLGRSFETQAGNTRATVNSENNGFEVRDVAPGNYQVRVVGTGGYLRAVSLGGQQLARPEVLVTADGPISGLKLHLAFDGATISGTVDQSTGEEDPEASAQQAVVLFPDSAANPYAITQFQRVREGVFQFENVTPGAYTLICAQNPGTFPDYMNVDDPQARQVFAPYAKRITVAANERATVELTPVPESAQLW